MWMTQRPKRIVTNPMANKQFKFILSHHSATTKFRLKLSELLKQTKNLFPIINRNVKHCAHKQWTESFPFDFPIRWFSRLKFSWHLLFSREWRWINSIVCFGIASNLAEMVRLDEVEQRCSIDNAIDLNAFPCRVLCEQLSFCTALLRQS